MRDELFEPTDQGMSGLERIDAHKQTRRPATTPKKARGLEFQWRVNRSRPRAVERASHHSCVCPNEEFIDPHNEYLIASRTMP